jgi:hypothetical protein
MQGSYTVIKSVKLLIIKDRRAFWLISLEYLLGKITSFHDTNIVILLFIFRNLTSFCIRILTYVIGENYYVYSQRCLGRMEIRNEE